MKFNVTSRAKIALVLSPLVASSASAFGQSTPVVPRPTPASSAGVLASAPRGLEAHYAQRELGASAAVRARLAKVRERAVAEGATYAVGYTSAIERSLADLSSVVEPPDAAVLERAARADVGRMQKDAAFKRAELEKTLPPRFRVAPRHVPSFTAGSARADWRAEGKVSPVRDQGGCRVGWAFATVGALESAYLINGRKQADASELAMLDCSGAVPDPLLPKCAQGGWPDKALRWLHTRGTPAESGYTPDRSMGLQSCGPGTPEYYAAAWGYAPLTVAGLKDAIAAHGPVVVAVAVSDAFAAYAGGVFNQVIAGTWPEGTVARHAVVLVGWDDGKQSWIVRNSWGVDWGEAAGGGERGYMYLRYGSSGLYHAVWVDAPALMERMPDRPQAP